MDLSITIVTHNTKRLLDECLRSVIESIDGIRYEIIVTDNGSRDGTVQMLDEKYPGVRVIRNEESVGFGRGNNQAFAVARGKFVLILEPDTLVKTPGAIGDMLRYMGSHPDVGALGPKLVLVRNGATQRSAFLRFPSLLTFFCEWTPVNQMINRLLPAFDQWGKYYYDESQLSAPTDVAWVMGGILMLRKDVIDQTGGFDEDIFLLAEDTDLCRSIRGAGYRIVYYPEAEIYHYWGVNQENLDFTLGCYYDGMGHYLAKHHSRFYRLMFVLVTFASSCISVAAYTMMHAVYARKREYIRSQRHWHAEWIRYLLSRRLFGRRT